MVISLFIKIVVLKIKRFIIKEMNRYIMGFWRKYHEMFTKKKRYNVDGRKLIVFDESKADDEIKNIIRESFLEVCKNDKIAKNFRVIKLVMQDKFVGMTTFGPTPVFHRGNDVSPAMLFHEELRQNEKMIHINIPKLEELFRYNYHGSASFMKKKICSIIAHELAHIWNFYVSNILSNGRKISGRLSNRISRLMKSVHISNEQKENLEALRVHIHNFKVAIMDEGLAKYYELASQKELPFEKSKFDELYVKAKNVSGDLKYMWGHYMGGDKWFESKLFSAITGRTGLYHHIGIHVVYTILYADQKISLDEIRKMSYFKFIKKYESCVKKEGQQPVVSLTSGKGILDYKRMLDQLMKLYNSLVRK